MIEEVVEARTQSRSGRLLSILLVHEEVIIRTGLRLLIDSWPNSKVVAEADNPTQALPVLNLVNPHVIVCAYTEDSADFFQSLRKLADRANHIRLILLTGSRNIETRALKALAGVKLTILAKQTADLRNALERMQTRDHAREKAWEKWIAMPPSGTPATKLSRQSRLDGDSFGSEKRITSREREVAVLVSQGQTNRQVGKHLGITEVTVRHHLTSIFHKLKIANRFELIAWLYRHDIVHP